MIKRNRKPAMPGKVLKDLFMDERGLSVSGLSQKLEVSRKHLSEIINGHQRISPNMAVRLAHHLETTPNLWLNLQNAVDIWEAEKEFYRSDSAAE
jgi:addiction module HigA family antidote